MATPLPYLSTKTPAAAPTQPFITVGNVANSGYNYDPGTVPSGGYVTSSPAVGTITDPVCAALQQALDACVQSPYSANTPADLVLTGAAYQAWVSGTPLPLMVKSGRQRIIGAGMRDTRLVLNQSSAQAAITVTGSPFTYLNPYAYPIILLIRTNGATWSTATPVQVSVGGVNKALQVPSGAGATNTAWNAYAGNISVCLGIGQSAILTFSAGTPALSASLAFLMWAADPSAIGAGVELLEVNAGTNTWGRGIDFSSDPNNGLGYAETTKPVRLVSVFTDNGAGWVDASVYLDGCEGAFVADPDISGGFYWRTTQGQQTIFGGFIAKAHLAGQTVNIQGTAFQDASTTTGITGITVDGINSHNDVIVSPTTMNYYGVTMNGSATSGTVVNNVVNNNKATNVIHNIFGGWFGQPAGTAVAFFATNESTTFINVFANPTFRKATSGTPAIIGAAQLGFTMQGGISPGGTATNPTLLANTPYASASAAAAAGLSNPFIVGATLQKAESGAADNNVLTFTPPAVAGTYRISFLLDCSASTAGIVGWTATWKDANSNAQAPTNLEMYDSSVLLGAFTFTLVAAHIYSGSWLINTDNSATNVVVKMTYTSGSLTAKVTAIIERIS
jgi:hypothetical protein